MSEFVRLEVVDGVGVIRLDRPPMNPINSQVQEGIRKASMEASERKDVHAVVVYGGEKVFAAGADIKEMQQMSYTQMADAGLRLQSSITSVAEIPKPTIAAVTGFALGGGCELALCCDFRVVGEKAKMGQPEVLLGLIPGMGGSQRLTRLVGLSKAKDLIFSGRFVKSDEALAIGLADKVVPDDQVFETAMTWAKSFVNSAPYAIRACKEIIDRGFDTDLATALEIERWQFAAIFATRDARIGMTSFIEHGPGKAQFVGE